MELTIKPSVSPDVSLHEISFIPVLDSYDYDKKAIQKQEKKVTFEEEKLLTERLTQLKIVSNSYFNNEKRKKEQLVLHTGILFADEIDYLFESRREIRKLKSLAFTDDYYLFEWMGNQNILEYYKFKEGLANVLTEIATNCQYCDFQVKHMIAYVLSRFLVKTFIK